MTPIIDPTILVARWLRAVVAAAGATTHVTTEVHPARGLPQLLLSPVRQVGIDDGPGGLADNVRSRLFVTVSGVGPGGDRPDHTAAWRAVQPVVDAAVALGRTPGGWVNATGERLISAAAINHTPTVAQADGTVRSTVSFELTLLVPAA